MFGLQQKHIDAINQCFAQYPQIEQVTLYGSRAKGNYKNGSDIDLTIVGDLDYRGLLRLENQLDDLLLPYKMDLSLKHKITNPDLLEHIERVGKVFYEKEKQMAVHELRVEYGRKPSEWKTYKLGDLVTFQRGHDLTRTQMQKGTYPVAGSNGVIGFHNEFTTKAPGITIGRSGNIGNVYYFETDFWAHNTTLYIKEFKNCDPKFIYYLLQTMNFGGHNSGSAVPSLNRNYIHPIEVKAPDLPTQKEIAQILTSLDDKIELNLQMNQTLEAMAQAIFKEWFVNFNFPGFDGELVDGLPKGWSYKTIKDLGKVVTGNTPSSKNPEYFGEVTPFVTPTDFKNFGKLIIGANRYLSVEGSKAMKTRLLPKHSIIVTCIGSDMGKVAINSIECVTNQQINSIISNDESFVDYLYYDLVYKYDYLRNIATGGSTMPIINKSRFEEIEILIPNSDVLENFQALMDSFNSKIEENIRQTQSLTQTRDTLLPKLISGQITVK